MSKRRAVAAVALAATCAGAIAPVGGPARAVQERTVPCDDIIDQTRWPYVGARKGEERYRIVLGVVAAPPAYMSQVVPTRERPWPYWHKQGLVVRGGAPPVTLVVPRRWRRRVAIVWGNSGPPASFLRLADCDGPRDTGNAYSGGFYLRAPSACVPLLVRVAKRTATVRFGLGRHCGRNRSG